MADRSCGNELRPDDTLCPGCGKSRCTKRLKYLGPRPTCLRLLLLLLPRRVAGSASGRVGRTQAKKAPGSTTLRQDNRNPLTPACGVWSKLLGHADISLTLNVYSHVLPDMGDIAAGAMDAALG